MKIRKRVHGHLIKGNIDIDGLSIEKTIKQLKRIGWNDTKLSITAKKTYEDCYLDRIIEELKICQESDELIRKTVKKHILNLYDDEVGMHFSFIYLICYTNQNGISVSLKDDLKKYIEEEGIICSKYILDKCIKKALQDGSYLAILNSDGSIRDNMFVMNWGYYYDNKLLESTISQLKSQAEEEDEKQWYTDLHRNRHTLAYTIEKKSKFNFSDPIIKHKKIKKDEKIRQVYSIEKKSVENVLIKYVKRELDRVFKIEYPNRNRVSEELFSLMKDIDSLSVYTIYRFDIENFFDSVSSEYIFNNYIKDSKLDANLKVLLNDFVLINKQCYAGIASSNTFIEIAGKQFDSAIKNELYKYGLIYYARYVDDGLIIVNSNIDMKNLWEVVEKNIKKYFGENVNLNKQKEKYITKNNTEDFNYLGYLYSKKTGKYKFGIEAKKIEKYKKVIEEIIDAYTVDKNQELLRQRIRFFISRIVYYNKQSIALGFGAWDVRGICANYSLLRSAIEENKVESQTEDFLKNGIYATLCRKTRGEKFYFINVKCKSDYSIWSGIEQKKSIVFNYKIGWSKDYLKKQLEKLECKSNKNYDELVKIYSSLIKLRK